MRGPDDATMSCRPGCAACCIAPSISTRVPSRDGTSPRPKPAGERCVQLDETSRCRLFGRAERPAVCVSLRPHAAMCGGSAAEAMVILARLESLTQPT